MPAETNSHRDAVTVDDLLDLLWAITGEQEGSDPDMPLDALGLTDDLAILDYWDAVVEEYGERGVGEPDLDALTSAATATDLAALTVENLRRGDRRG